MKNNIKFFSILSVLLLVATPVLAADIDMAEKLNNFVREMGFVSFFAGEGWKNAVMIGIGCFLLFLAIVKKYEPLLLLPIAFGMILTNLPGAGMFDSEMWNNEFLNHESPYYHSYGHIMAKGGLLDILYIGVKAGIYPCLIFLGVGAMTDFGPLIANPRSLLLGAAAQIGIFATFIVTQMDLPIFGFTPEQAASIGIIGGADGPTAIFLTSKLAPELLGPIAVAAYSYMALVPAIPPPIMRILTTEKDRKIKMDQLRTVSRRDQIVFPIVVAVIVSLVVPSAATLIGCLMLGNLMKESGVVDRLSKAAQDELNNIVVICLGLTVGATATASSFMNWQTIGILAVGIVAFGIGSASGVLMAKFMNLFLKEKINPLIGSAGVSAVPMAARVSQTEGAKADPRNFLLMHAMGPNVAGVIGSAVAAGILLSILG